MVDINPEEAVFSQGKFAQMFQKWFVQHLYRQEDTLFKVLFDLKHRPDVYRKVQYVGY